MAIRSAVYLFGGNNDGLSSNRVVVFENYIYKDIGTFSQRRLGHSVIQVDNFVYIIINRTLRYSVKFKSRQ